MTSSPSEVGRITLERVTFRYLEQSKRPVLDEVSASFDRSRITVLTGNFLNLLATSTTL